MNKRELFNLIIGTVLIVVLFIAFSSLIDGVQANDTFTKWYKMDLYIDHHHSNSYLVINHSEGKPGSYFKLTGCNFSANGVATVVINGTTLGNVQVDNLGCFIFELNTAQANDGLYFVTATVNPSATINFRLNSGFPSTWPSEGVSSVFSVPAGIAFTESIYLPIIIR